MKVTKSQMQFLGGHLHRNISEPASSGLSRRWFVEATLFFGLLDCIAADIGAVASEGTGTVSGQSITPERTQYGFGAVQGLPPLPLAANEYVVTIDDGPSAKTTPQLLDALRTHQVKATFFLIGRNAAANPGLVKEISAQGHSIGSHSYRHPNLAAMTEAEIVEEMQRGVDAVEAAQDGVRGINGRRLVRLPGSGSSSPIPTATLIEALHQNGLTIAGYDLSPQDWRNSPPEESFKRLFHGIRDRGVIVFHDGQPNTILLLPMVLEELSRRGGKIRQLVPRLDDD